MCNNVCDVCIMVASEVPNLCFLMFNSLLEIFWNLELVFPKPTLICTKGQKPSVPRQFLHRLINGSIPLSKRPISFSILCRTPWSCIPNVPRSFPETHWVSMFECVFHSLDRLWQHGKGTHRCTHRVKKRNKEEGWAHPHNQATTKPNNQTTKQSANRHQKKKNNIQNCKHSKWQNQPHVNTTNRNHHHHQPPT